MCPALGLGTAQFGLAYGITNTLGITEEHEARDIIQSAVLKEISWIDTAQGYGNAERVVGDCNLPENTLSIVTKKSPDSGKDDAPLRVQKWEDSFTKTLKNLRATSIEGFLIHDAKELRSEYGEALKEWLISLRDRGLARKIGVSVYSPDEIVGIDQELLDIIQLPVSLYDQRAVDHTALFKAKEKGSQIHARSIFLQGLLASSTEDWPRWLPGDFKESHNRLTRECNVNGCRTIDIALGFIKCQNWIDVAFTGVCTRNQLNELKTSWDRDDIWPKPEYSKWGLTDQTLLDPRAWPQ